MVTIPNKNQIYLKSTVNFESCHMDTPYTICVAPSLCLSSAAFFHVVMFYVDTVCESSHWLPVLYHILCEHLALAVCLYVPCVLLSQPLVI